MSAFARNNFSHATYNASDQQSNSSHACSSGYFDCSLCVTAEMGFDGVMSVSHACLYQACVVSSVSELECRSSVSVLPCLSGVPRAGAQIQPRRALGSKDYGKRTVKICASRFKIRFAHRDVDPRISIWVVVGSELHNGTMPRPQSTQSNNCRTGGGWGGSMI